MKRRGLSLAEVLMGIFLMATVMSLMMLLLFPSLWMWRSEQAHSEVQQGVLVAVSRLQQMLLNCEFESLTVVGSPPALAFQEVVGEGTGFDAVSGNPILETQAQVVYRDAATRRIIHKTWSKAPPALNGIDFNATSSHLIRLGPGHIAQVVASSLNPRVLAANVEIFELSDDDKDLTILNPPIHARIRCQLTMEQSNKQEGFEMTLSVTPRSLRL